jgi:hypothetical protein
MDALYINEILCVFDSVPSLDLLMQGHIWNAHRSAYYLALLHFTGAVIPFLSLSLSHHTGTGTPDPILIGPACLPASVSYFFPTVFICV